MSGYNHFFFLCRGEKRRCCPSFSVKVGIAAHSFSYHTLKADRIAEQRAISVILVDRSRLVRNPSLLREIGNSSLPSIHSRHSLPKSKPKHLEKLLQIYRSLDSKDASDSKRKVKHERHILIAEYGSPMRHSHRMERLGSIVKQLRRPVLIGRKR